ncbi:MAG: hypothetical protein HOE76_03790 [Euryarchaeota archaeon]|jgi:predicted RNA binding protein with dsRBD fold (UPF0201 family)|nr:hypothetical protein [Euryarchaeota archaeon]MBT4982243.1 hypothetical protein [Euryarchaeota archaeon]MBT5183870.1 hypothetical protein [Euryarchaeota archaeon]
MARLKLNGVNENLSVLVSSKLTGADDPEIVLDAILTIFPEFRCGLPSKPTFPTLQNDIIAAEGVPLDGFLDAIHRQAILDTSLDFMSTNLDSTGTMFQISRQAAMSGKVAFPLPGDTPLGGVIVVEIGGENLEDWLEAATWHNGRENIPRRVRDEFTMDGQGEAVTWH